MDNIGNIIRYKDLDTYRKLLKIGTRKKKRKKKRIKLGDRPEKLMQHDAYKRISRRIRQIRWG